MTDSDPVNHPAHYTQAQVKCPCGNWVTVEPADIIDNLGLAQSHWVATAFEYLWRCRHKNAFLQDLKKAVWNLWRAIDVRTGRSPIQPLGRAVTCCDCWFSMPGKCFHPDSISFGTPRAKAGVCGHFYRFGLAKEKWDAAPNRT